MKIFPSLTALLLMGTMAHSDVVPASATEVAAVPAMESFNEVPTRKSRDDIDVAKVDRDVKDALNGTMLFLLMLSERAGS